MAARYRAAFNYVGNRTKLGEVIFSPIVYYRPMALEFDLPHTFDFWQHINDIQIKCCESMRILMLDGWNVSKGVTSEIKKAQEYGKIIELVDPVTYSLTIRSNIL